MDNFLLHLALLTIRAYSLVVGAVLFTIPLNLDRSYVDDSSCVVFIIDTTHSNIIQRGVQGYLSNSKNVIIFWKGGEITIRSMRSRPVFSSKEKSVRRPFD